MKAYKFRRVLAVIAIMTMLSQNILTALATGFASQITDKQQEIKETQSQLNSLNSQISSMESKQELVEEQLADVDAEVINMMTEIGMIEETIAEITDEISQKELEIAQNQAELEKAKADEQTQHDDMVIRIRAMYENDDDDIIGMLFHGYGLAETLNRIEYSQSVYDYDRQKLEEYTQTREYVERLGAQLDAEYEELSAKEYELTVEKASLEESRKELVNLQEQLKKQSKDYENKIKRAAQQASVAKTMLLQEQAELKRLEAEDKKAKEEALAKARAEAAAQAAAQAATQPANSNASGSELGQNIADYACQFVGNPYVAGGTSLTNGADCSGFTYRVYMDFGITLPRTASSQRTKGTSVGYSNAQPGDLVFYSGHVAIYIGNGQIVHASTPKNGIRISSATYNTILDVRRYV